MAFKTRRGGSKIRLNREGQGIEDDEKRGVKGEERGLRRREREREKLG